MGTERGPGGFRIADHQVAMPEIATVVIALAALAIAMLLVWRRATLGAAGLAVLTAAGAWISASEPTPHLRAQVMEVTAIALGQGDSILVVSPQAKPLLVDAGGAVGGQQTDFDYGENVVSPYLWTRGISRLDVVAITHGHSDHIGGMLADVFTTRNNDSLVLRLRYRDWPALLEGDGERAVEQRMIATHDLQADLLKVGHHEGNTSSTPELIEAVRPRWAVMISVGTRNTFGHARMEMLRRLRDAKVATYRTDLEGAVTFYLDGHLVSPQPACLR